MSAPAGALEPRRSIVDALHCICGAELEDPRFRTCEACRSKHRDRMRSLIAVRRVAGRCVRCDAKAEAGAHCRRCWFAMMARNALGSRSRGPDLARLWLAQGGRCAYTGRQLTPGVNASVDHVLPRSRGGSDELDNLVWTCAAVNRAKTDMTPAEFRALCAEVLAHDASQNACANDVSGENETTLPANGPINIRGIG